ncbi:hypothetical protein [Uliginosibacterium gangwonense]|uniref:hypothetical protein n=1 Tax=Uliginosibacterium gangwonense TaxID=392736 RepID=UPI00038248B7|nr:hypothetical protein [Uliginosibacterium gangwonense]
MSIISDFLKRKTIDIQAQKFSAQFLQRLPLHRIHDKKKFDVEFGIIFAHIQGYQRKEKLGFYGEARLVNAFQWGLISAGYEKHGALKLGRQITARLRSAQKRPKA